MTITPQTLRRIATMSAEAMVEALLFLADQQEVEDARKAREAERKRRYRDKHGTETGQSGDIGGTKRGQDGDTRARDVEINNKLPEDNKTNTPPCSPSKPKKTWETSPEFVELLAVFPPRSGDKDLKGSFNAFNAARKRETFPVIIDGAKRYRDHIDATGKMNTEYVRQIRTWLNKDGWKETYGQDRLSHTGNNTVSKGFNNIRDAINRRFGVEDARGDGGGGEIIDVLPGLRKGA